MAFTHKRINVQFQMANGQFEGGGNNHTVSGLRVSCHIENTGGFSNSKLFLSIYGLPLSVMNQLSTVGTQYNKMYKNSIIVEAGDDETGMSMVFAGVIATAFVDAQGMPQVCFRVVGMPGAYEAVKPTQPTTVKGPANAEDLMQQLAKTMGVAFENHGVKVKLTNPYYWGTPWQQAQALARDGGFDMIVDKKVMVIIPPDKTRAGGATLISPETGLVGYPAFNQAYVLVQAMFDPKVQYGGEIEIKSDLTPANGKWKVAMLEYDLESEMPHGKWFMIIQGTMIGPTTP